MPQLEEPTTKSTQLCTGGLWGEKGKNKIFKKKKRFRGSRAPQAPAGSPPTLFRPQASGGREGAGELRDANCGLPTGQHGLGDQCGVHKEMQGLGGSSPVR